MHQHLAVLGSPILHSRSPRIHRAAYAALGLDWQYEALECRETELARLLDSRDENWRGFSVTMPLKEEAHRLSAVLDPVAAESGVVNTLFRLAGGAGWAGFNTDVPGLAAAIDEAALDASHTVVIGSGATAVSAVLAVRRLGAGAVRILARNHDAMHQLVTRFDGTSEPASERQLSVSAAHYDDATRVVFAGGATPTLVISTLPGPAASELVLPDSLTAAPLFDVAYDPWPSPLAERWRAQAGEAHAGLGMLLHQALLQVRIFVEGDPSLPLEREADVFAAMRAAA